MNSTRKMLPVGQRNSSTPSTLDPENRTIEAVLTTADPVPRRDWNGDTFMESLDMSPGAADLSRMQGGPLLADHDNSIDSVLGTVQKAWVQGDEVRGIVQFADTEKANNVFKMIQSGHIKSLSIGYRVRQYKQKKVANGETPLFVGTKWSIFETSVVAVPADNRAQFKANNNEPNECEILLATPKEHKKMNEKERILGIQRACRAANLDEAFAEDLIQRDVTMADASQEIFKILEEQTGKGQKRSIVTVFDESNHETLQRGHTEAILARNPNFKPTTDAVNLFRGRSLLSMAEIRFPRKMGESDMAFATRAMTTSDLPNILANVAEKEMREAYVAAPQSFKPFTKAGTLRNYKVANRLQLGSAPQLQALDEAGEVVMGSTVESKETIQLKRYTSGIAFTKEMLVNDDLSALSGFSSKYAQQAQNLESNLVYGILTANANMGDGNALFSSAHSNLAGSGAAISVTSVGLAWASMMKQTDLSGTYLNLQPAYLVVPPEIMTVANQLVSQALLANAVGSINPFAGKLTVIADARLSANSTTAWYLACNVSQLACLELSMLEGESGPLVFVEPNYKAPGNVRIICDHSVGAGALDYRGLYKNPGA